MSVGVPSPAGVASVVHIGPRSRTTRPASVHSVLYPWSPVFMAGKYCEGSRFALTLMLATRWVASRATIFGAPIMICPGCRASSSPMSRGRVTLDHVDAPSLLVDTTTSLVPPPAGAVPRAYRVSPAAARLDTRTPSGPATCAHSAPSSERYRAGAKSASVTREGSPEAGAVDRLYTLPPSSTLLLLQARPTSGDTTLQAKADRLTSGEP